MVPHGTAPHGTAMERTEEIALATAVSVPRHVEKEVETEVGMQWHYADTTLWVEIWHCSAVLVSEARTPFNKPTAAG